MYVVGGSELQALSMGMAVCGVSIFRYIVVCFLHACGKILLKWRCQFFSSGGAEFLKTKGADAHKASHIPKRAMESEWWDHQQQHEYVWSSTSMTCRDYEASGQRILALWSASLRMPSGLHDSSFCHPVGCVHLHGLMIYILHDLKLTV